MLSDQTLKLTSSGSTYRNIDDVVASLLLSSKRGNLVGDARNENLSGGGDKLGEESEKVGHGLCRMVSRTKDEQCSVQASTARS